VRKRPEIPEDVFFDTGPARDEPEDEPQEPEAQPEPEAEEASAEDEVLAKSMDRGGDERPPVDLDEARAERSRERVARERRAAEEARDGSEKMGESSSRVGRPPAQEGPKTAVTLYLTEPVAHLLEEVKFRLLTEYDVKTSKSAIADFALRHGLDDLQAAADDLRRE
jgi:hypothetical protein